MPQGELATGRIARVAAALVLAVVGAVIVASLLRGGLQIPVSGDGASPRAELAAGAAPLLSAPRPERDKVRAAKLRRLNGIGWVDAARGTAHIPIDRAIDLLAQAPAAPAAPARAADLPSRVASAAAAHGAAPDVAAGAAPAPSSPGTP